MGATALDVVSEPLSTEDAVTLEVVVVVDDDDVDGCETRPAAAKNVLTPAMATQRRIALTRRRRAERGRGVESMEAVSTPSLSVPWEPAETRSRKSCPAVTF
jgi:hypothetical protein